MSSYERQHAVLQLAIVRSASRLTLVQSRRSGDFVPPGDRDSSVLASLFGIEWIPLTAPRLPAPLVDLAAAWERLSSVGSPDGAVAAEVLPVLVSTVPSAEEVAGPPQRLDKPPAAPRSTAAHPRAFRGTRYKPPKPPQSVKGDLRPLLGASSSTRSLLSA